MWSLMQLWQYYLGNKGVSWILSVRKIIILLNSLDSYNFTSLEQNNFDFVHELQYAQT
jgi:hypothetical protein